MSEWISVEDRLPELYEYVLVYKAWFHEPKVKVCRLVDRIDTHWEQLNNPPTHWMPLPAPPNQTSP